MSAGFAGKQEEEKERGLTARVYSTVYDSRDISQMELKKFRDFSGFCPLRDSTVICNPLRSL